VNFASNVILEQLQVSQPQYSKGTIDGLVADVMFSFQRH